MASNLTPEAQKRVDSSARKAGSVSGSLIGTLVVLAVVCGGIYALMMGIPYLYNRATVPWAGAPGGANSLLGVWVGELPVHAAADPMAWSRHHAAAPATPEARAAVMLIIHMQFAWGVPKVRGTAVACTTGGQKQSSHFNEEWVQNPASMDFVLKGDSGAPPISHLSAQFTPGTLNIQWPFNSSDQPQAGGPGAAGVLHKGDSSQFQALCDALH